jgi:hypothetical protein
MSDTSFTNELGNEIQISVKTVAAIEIKISGPASESTNLITREEACRLRDALAAALTLGGEPS